MKQIKDSLDKAIGELANRDQKTVDRLLDIVDRMAVDLRPAVRRSVAPIGETCRTMTFSSAERKDTFDEADKAAILRSEDDEITENRHFDISITELDLERGTCKTRMLGDAEDKRISAVITDPQLQQSNNPYSLAFAAGEAISVIAKALIKDGEVDRLFISDVAV